MLGTTPRERLLGALLCWHEAIRQYNATPGGRGTGRQLVAARAAAEAVRRLLEAAEMLTPTDEDVLTAVGYGLPAWLVDDPDNSALAVMTGEQAEEIAATIGPDGRRMFDNDDLTLLDEASERLVRASATRLLPTYVHDYNLLFARLARGLVDGGGTLAAAHTGDSPGERRREIASRTALPGAYGPLELEFATRLLRVDVPVVFDDRAGAVLGLHAELGESDDGQVRTTVSDENEVVLAQSFRNGVRTGHLAAVQLLADIGASPERMATVRHLEYTLAGLPAGCPQLVDGSAGLPVALHVLAHALDLATLPCATTGSLSSSGVLDNMPPAKTEVKLAAVLADGFRPELAARAPGLGRREGFVELTGHTLAQAAEQLWAEDWRRAVRAGAAAQLAEAGCRVARGIADDPAALRADDGSVIGVRSREHDEVTDYLDKYPTTPVVLGGPPCVGKSWTVRSVARELGDAGWHVLSIRFEQNRLPDREKAAHLVALALTAHPPGPGRPTLLVLEDLHAHPGANNLDRVLLGIVAKTGYSVLAEATASDGSPVKWIQDNLHVIRFRHDQSELTRLARELVGKYRQRFGAAEDLVGVVAAASAGDMWWMVRLLEFAGGHGRTGMNDRELHATFTAERMAGLDDEARHAAAVLAAYSEIGIPAPVEDLAPLTGGQLVRLGAYSEDGTAWYLPSPAAQMSLLRSLSTRYVTAVQTGLVGPLRRLLDGQDMNSVLSLLRNAGRVSDGEVLERLVRDQRDTLVARLDLHADAVQLATALFVLRLGLTDAEQGRLVRTLATRLSTRGWARLSAEQIISILNALRVHDRVLGDDGDESELWDNLMRRLDAELGAVTERITPSQAWGLIRALDRLSRWEQAASVFERICRSALRHVRPNEGDDVVAALELLNLVRGIDRRAGRIAGGRLREQILDSPGGRRLAAIGPGDGDAFDYLATVALVESMGATERSPSASELESQLRARLPRTHPARFADGLRLLRSHAPGRLRDVRRADLAGVLDTVLEESSPLASAQLTLALTRLHPKLGVALYYDRLGECDQDRLDSYARRLLERPDLRTAGLVVNACARLDEEFVVGANGFAERLATRLHPLWRTLTGERQASIADHVVRTLVDASPDVTLLEELRDVFLSFIEVGFAGDAGDGSEARIALVLSADEVLGHAFRARLHESMKRRSIDRRELLARMRASHTPEALAAYHSFAMVLDPTLCNDFSRQLGSVNGMVNRLRDKRTLAVLRALRVTSRTLGYAGRQAMGRELVHLFERDARNWGTRLGQIRSADELRQCVDLLSDLDPAVARQGLDRITRSAAGPGARAGADTLVDYAVSADVPLEHAVGLLAAVARAHPELAQDTARQLNRSPAWARRRRWLADAAHPSRQGQILLDFSTAGLSIMDGDRHRVRDAWLDMANLMRSPWTISTMLNGLLAVDPRLAATFAGQLDATALVRRLSYGHHRDTGAFGPLLVTLIAAGRAGLAGEIARSLPDNPVRGLTIAQSAGLLAAAREAAPEVVGPLAGRFHDDLLTAALDRSLVLDPNSHLISIGWLARELDTAGVERPERSWPALAVVEHEVARLWGEAWLARTGSRSADLPARVEAAARSGRGYKPWALAAVLTVAGSLGIADKVLALRSDWANAVNAGNNWLTELVAEAGNDPALSRFLVTHKDALTRSARRQTKHDNLHSARLSRLVNEM